MQEENGEEFIDSITPDVMRVLEQCGFFLKLDDLFSPEDGSPPLVKCSGNYEHSERLLRSMGFDDEELIDIFDVLRSRGGFCDCEVLYNAAEESRLKAGYWRARHEELQRSVTHTDQNG